MSRIFIRVRIFLVKLNLFDSESPYEHILQRERLSTRFFIISLLIIVTFLFIYMLLFMENTRTLKVKSPSPDLIARLHEKYSMTLSCPCMQISMPYSTFLSVNVRDIQHLL